MSRIPLNTRDTWPFNMNMRQGSSTRLEGAVLNRVEILMDRAWRPTSNNDRLATELQLLCDVLKLAGYDVDAIYRRWKSDFRTYQLGGGRAKYRGIGEPE